MATLLGGTVHTQTQIQDWLTRHATGRQLNEPEASYFRGLADGIAMLYPEPDQAAEAQAAMVAAYRLIVEDPAAVVAALAADRRQARTAERGALAGLGVAARVLIAAGAMTEAGFSRAAGVDRMAVRAWQGK